MVLRDIHSAEDFLKYYGHCIISYSVLKVREVRPAVGHTFGITLLSAADRAIVESLNGTVSVNSSQGRVTLLVLAYQESFYLP
jgi:hypothetical protein